MAGGTVCKGHFQRQSRRKLLIICTLLLLLILLIIITLQSGSYKIGAGQILLTLLGRQDDPLIQHLVFSLRLTRIISAMLAGVGLAISGNIMQTLLKNPLASPSTLGISQGAAFGAACAIILFSSGQTTGLTTALGGVTALCAFAGASVGILVIFLLSTVRRLSGEGLILAGVAIASFFTACTMLLQYFATDTQVAATLFWTFGDLGKGGWYEITLMALLLIPAMFFVLFNGWNLNSLQWGEDVARTLGVNTRLMLFTGLGLTSVLTAIITASLGIIPFVGLMAPHIIRPLIGTDQRYLLPASALAGALLLLLADLLSRTVMAPLVIPVGIITSFTGAPLFLFLLLRRRSV